MNEEQKERLELFFEGYPEYKKERCEIADDGTVYVHGNCAYPLIIKTNYKIGVQFLL